MNNKRYIPLIDEIKYHVFQWATDEEWKKIPSSINVALTTLMNELKIHESLKKAGQLILEEDGSDNLKKHKQAFINLFKQKYLELTDMNFNENISPVNQVNIDRVITTLANEGGKYTEFIEWFFDDFCSLESNKKFLPPQINFMCSSNIVNKYLFVMKDALKIRKKTMANIEVKNMLLGIALPFAERTKNKELSQKMLDFSRDKITCSKFFNLLKAFANKLDDKEAIEQCNKIDLKMEENKKKTS